VGSDREVVGLRTVCRKPLLQASWPRGVIPITVMRRRRAARAVHASASACRLKPERPRWPGPKGIDASDLIAVDRIGPRPRADAVDITASINQPAGCVDSCLGRGVPYDAVLATAMILNVSSHCEAMVGPAPDDGK